MDIGCYLSLVDLFSAAVLSCKQRLKSVNKLVWFYCYYCTARHFNNLFLHRLRKSLCIRPSSGQSRIRPSGQKVWPSLPYSPQAENTELRKSNTRLRDCLPDVSSNYQFYCNVMSFLRPAWVRLESLLIGVGRFHFKRCSTNGVWLHQRPASVTLTNKSKIKHRSSYWSIWFGGFR